MQGVHIKIDVKGKFGGVIILTFGRMIHGVLQILHHPFLPNGLLNLPLGVRIEGIGIEQGELALFFLLDFFHAPLHRLPDIAKAPGVGDGPREVRVGGTDLRENAWVAQSLQPDHLRIRLGRATRRPAGGGGGMSPGRAVRGGWAGGGHGGAVEDEHPQHVVLGDAAFA